jgi:hypothetical protein
MENTVFRFLKKLFAFILFFIGVLSLAYAIFALRICIIDLDANVFSQGGSFSEYSTEIIMYVSTNVLPYLFYAFFSCGIGLLLLNKQYLHVQDADGGPKAAVNGFAVDFDDSDDTDSDDSDDNDNDDES